MVRRMVGDLFWCVAFAVVAEYRDTPSIWIYPYRKSAKSRRDPRAQEGRGVMSPFLLQIWTGLIVGMLIGIFVSIVLYAFGIRMHL